MMVKKTFQIAKIVDSVLEKLKKSINVKGTDNVAFREYQTIFNSLTRKDRKFIVYQLISFRSKFIKHCVENKDDVYLEGLGTFKYKEDRDKFIHQFRDKVAELGYERLNKIPADVKFKIVNEINDSMDKTRLDNYFKRLKTNSEKRFVPTPVYIKLNISKSIKEV